MADYSYNNPSYPPGAGPPGAYPPGAGPPGGIHMQPQPQGGAGCPPGLEYLTQVDQILVHQAVELLEAFTGIETQNRFQVKNAMGQQIFYAAEESGCCTRQFCGSSRGFVMHLADNMGNEVIRAKREFKCCAGRCGWCACCDCCAYEIVVEAPLGTPCGYVRQVCSLIHPCFEVKDANHETILKIEGPMCICECPCCDIAFRLFSLNGEEVGQVSKQWSGLVKEMFTEADNFGISFPMDLDVNAKATLIGAVFLINMMFFENNDQKNNQ